LAIGVVAAAGGYYYFSIKPAVDTVNQLASIGGDKTKQALAAASKGDSDTLSALAKSALPPTAFALYEKVSKDGSGFITKLQDKDFKGVVDEVKKMGGDDVKRVIEKIETKVSEANGSVTQVDWKALAEELKQELPKDKQQMVDVSDLILVLVFHRECPLTTYVDVDRTNTLQR
jgi:hypothetical protein